MSATPLSAGRAAGRPSPPPAAERSSVSVRAGAIQGRFPVVQVIALVVLFEWGTYTDHRLRQPGRAYLLDARAGVVPGPRRRRADARRADRRDRLLGRRRSSRRALRRASAQLTGTRPLVVHRAALAACALLAVRWARSTAHLPPFAGRAAVVTLGMAAIVTGAVLVWTKAQATGTAPAVAPRLTSVPRAPRSGSTSRRSSSSGWSSRSCSASSCVARSAGRRLYATRLPTRVAAELALVRTRRVWVGAFACQRAARRAARACCSRATPARATPTLGRSVPVRGAGGGDRRRHGVRRPRRLLAHGAGGARADRAQHVLIGKGYSHGRPADHLRRPHPRRRVLLRAGPSRR